MHQVLSLATTITSMLLATGSRTRSFSTNQVVRSFRYPRRYLSHASSTSSDNERRLEYQHSFHAGNFADVVKHVVLVSLLQQMLQKKTNKPIGYVETHAGAGLYKLSRDEKDYETEHERGIFRLLHHRQDSTNLPAPIATYLEIVQSCQTTEKHNGLIYPGSPLFAAHLLTKNAAPNPNCSMLLYEKAPVPHQQLQSHLSSYPTLNIEAQCDNGYTQLARHAHSTSNLPPRTLIMIDPPYQYGSDTDQIVQLCQTLHRHWRSARIAIWHPVRQDHADNVQRLYTHLQQSLANTEILTLEAHPPPPTLEDDTRKPDVGSGMILIQPPYGMEQACRHDICPTLVELLYPTQEQAKQATIRVEWL